MDHIPSTKWLIWLAAAMALAALPAVCRADCNHPSPRFVSASSSGGPTPRLRFVHVREKSENPQRLPVNPTRLPCLHCGSPLPSLPPVVTAPLGGNEAICGACFSALAEPWQHAFLQLNSIYAFTPIDAIEHPPRAG